MLARLLPRQVGASSTPIARQVLTFSSLAGYTLIRQQSLRTNKFCLAHFGTATSSSSSASSASSSPSTSSSYSTTTLSKSSSVDATSTSAFSPPPLYPIPPRRPTSPLSSPSDPIQFHHLADVPELIPEVTRAIWTEWNHIYTQYFHHTTIEKAMEYMKESMCHRDQLNSTFVATVNGKFAATAALATEDFPLGTPYHGTIPWLISVWTAPEYRGGGIAMKLMQRLFDRTREMGYEHIWLMTPNLQDVYERKFGVKTIETIEAYDSYYTIMRLDFDKTKKWKLTSEEARANHEKKEKEKEQKKQL